MRSGTKQVQKKDEDVILSKTLFGLNNE